MSIYTDQLTQGLVSALVAGRDPMQGMLVKTLDKELVHKDVELTDLVATRLKDCRLEARQITMKMDELRAEAIKAGVPDMYSATIAQMAKELEGIEKQITIWTELQARIK